MFSTSLHPFVCTLSVCLTPAALCGTRNHLRRGRENNMIGPLRRSAWAGQHAPFSLMTPSLLVIFCLQVFPKCVWSRPSRARLVWWYRGQAEGERGVHNDQGKHKADSTRVGSVNFHWGPLCISGQQSNPLQTPLWQTSPWDNGHTRMHTHCSDLLFLNIWWVKIKPWENKH